MSTNRSVPNAGAGRAVRTSEYADNYTSRNPVVRYFFNSRLAGALSITARLEPRPLSSLAALEIGCFDGRFSFMLGSHYKSVVATEVEPEYLPQGDRIPGAQRSNVCLCAADVFSLPFRDATFDVVYGLGVFEHLHAGNKPYEELCRVLKPGGKLVAGLPVEVGVSLLVKKVVLDLLGRGRVTLADVARSLRFGEEHGANWNQGHRDYNWRKTAGQIVDQGMRILAKRYLPVPALGALGNPFVVVVAEKERT